MRPTRTPSTSRAFVVKEINSLEALPTWSSTAVILAYDDSDGLYDHVVQRGDQPVADVGRRPDRRGPVRDGNQLPVQRAGPLRLRPAAAAARGHLPYARATPSATPSPTSRRSSSSSSTTGRSARSPARRPTSPGRSTACSTSPMEPSTRRRSSCLPRPASRCVRAGKPWMTAPREPAWCRSPTPAASGRLTYHR